MAETGQIPRPVAPAAREGAWDGPAWPRTVLSVEDSPINMKILCRYLERTLGCRVLQAESVEAALLVLVRERPDLIVTDIMMPELDGFDLVAILQARAAWRDIPVVVHSAVDDLARVRVLIGLGVRDYVLKPFVPATCVPRLKRVLDTLPRGDARPPEPPRAGGIPVVVATGQEALSDLVRGTADALFEVAVARSGPEAVGLAMALRPWTILLGGALGPWDLDRTLRTFSTFRTLQGARVVPLPDLDRGTEAVTDLLRTELAPPLTVGTGEGTVTLTLGATFAPTCLAGLRPLVEARLGSGTRQLAVEMSPRGLRDGERAALRELAQTLRLEVGFRAAQATG